MTIVHVNPPTDHHVGVTTSLHHHPIGAPGADHGNLSGPTADHGSLHMPDGDNGHHLLGHDGHGIRLDHDVHTQVRMGQTGFGGIAGHNAGGWSGAGGYRFDNGVAVGGEFHPGGGSGFVSVPF